MWRVFHSVWPVIIPRSQLIPVINAMRSRFGLSLLCFAVLLLGGACRRTKPLAGRPSPTITAELERARADSIERADAARRANAATAEELARLEREGVQPAELAERTIAAAIYFELDRADLSDEARQTLDAKLSVLQAQRAIRIRIEGHADDTGSDEYNLALSQRRAAVANEYLVTRGIDSRRITTQGFGEERPACSGQDESCRSRNRRDEFIVIAGR
jgi:peptidoglycan-associated lipoprotein